MQVPSLDISQLICTVSYETRLYVQAYTVYNCTVGSVYGQT